MDEFKISLFEDEYGIPFPNHKILDKLQGQQLKQEIAKRYNISISNFENELLSKQSFYEQYDALQDFNLKKCLTTLGITSNPQVFLNWYQFERVDAINVDDLSKYFYDIWFPSSDDIDLLDDSFNWVVSIRHDGIITYVKYQND